MEAASASQGAATPRSMALCLTVLHRCRVCFANGRRGSPPARPRLARFVAGVWSPAHPASEVGAGDTLQRGWTLKSYRVKGQEPDTEAQILCDCSYVTHLEQADSRRHEVERRLPGAGGGETGHGVSVWGDEHVWGQRAVTVAQHCACTSCH